VVKLVLLNTIRALLKLVAKTKVLLLAKTNMLAKLVLLTPLNVK
jgi:hypothetical protein